MSDYESHKGKIVKLERGRFETVEQQMLRLWIEAGKEETDFDEDDWEYDMDDKYFLLGGDVYKVLEHKRLSDDSDMFCELSKNKDEGSISFFTRFYNGGTCLSEMLSESISKCKGCKRNINLTTNVIGDVVVFE